MGIGLRVGGGGVGSALVAEGEAWAGLFAGIRRRGCIGIRHDR